MEENGKLVTELKNSLQDKENEFEEVMDELSKLRKNQDQLKSQGLDFSYNIMHIN